MEGLSVELGFCGVAESAFHRGNVCCGMREGYVLVAESTAHSRLPMNRRSQRLCRHQQAVGISRTLQHGWVSMAHETHVVSLAMKGFTRDGKSQEEQECSRKSSFDHPHLSNCPENHRV